MERHRRDFACQSNSSSMRTCYSVLSAPQQINIWQVQKKKNRKAQTSISCTVGVTCASCLLPLSFSARELSCAAIFLLALRSSRAESAAAFRARRSTSTCRCRDSTRWCREEEEEEAFISCHFFLFSPLVPRSCCLLSKKRKRTCAIEKFTWEHHIHPNDWILFNSGWSLLNCRWGEEGNQLPIGGRTLYAQTYFWNTVNTSQQKKKKIWKMLQLFILPQRSQM